MKKTPIGKPVTTLINNALRRAKLEQRFIRGRGYYYVTGVAVSSMLCCMWLDQTAQDLEMARDHVNGVLAEEGVHFHLDNLLNCVPHPIGYTGHLRHCAQRCCAPLSLNDWRNTLSSDHPALRMK